MKHPRNRTKLMIGIAVALLTGGLAAAPALAGPNQGVMQRTGPGSAERLKQETVVVTAIDRSARTVTLQNAEGEKKTVKVPPEVKAYDALTVGARIDITYQESLAVAMMPTGSKPSMSERTVDGKAEGAVAGGAREMQLSAEVVSVDVAANTVTFKGPKGQLKTITVADPQMQKKLPSLKPGQVVQFTYTEAVAASIRPAPATGK
jgi:hypothetical protein